MTEHGRDPRLTHIAEGIDFPDVVYPSSLGGERDPGLGYVGMHAGTSLGAYTQFYALEATNKVWDIKQKIRRELGSGVVLCGEVCDWYDYSTVGNIHFGYVSGIAGIDPSIAAFAGGILEQVDSLHTEGRPHLEYCDGIYCENPQDQAAVDFGYYLARKYPLGISGEELRQELTVSWTGRFQRPIDPNFQPPGPAVPQPNGYGPDYFNNP
jgi:hypothetical protein